ncbi:MAG: molybdopterin-dependent oxidoreductase, partial [Desulfobacterales bacterium]|nr:molybdopterin-dependent oxidoreductase [Desulfobacterales bacterium]
MADIVLPAATHFEFNDIGHYGLGHGCILARPKIVEPPGECRPDMEILNELGKAMTPPEYWHESYEGFLEELLAPSGLDWEGFVRQGVLKGEERFSKHLSAGFRTPTGKVELALSTADKFKLPALPRFQGLPEEEDPDRPFTLTSAKDRFYLHSSYRWVAKLRRARPDPVVRIHPEAAKPLGIEENDEVIIETRFGSITQFAHLTEKIHPSVICAAYGWWLPEGDPCSLYEWEKHNYNILTSAEKLGKEFGTPNLKGVRCSIRKKENSTANERQ